MSERALKIGIVMDPIADITYKKDTTLAMMWAAQDRGWSLYYLEPEDLYLNQGRVHGRLQELQAFRDPHHWYELGEVEPRPLPSLM